MNAKRILSITKKYLRLRPELEPVVAGAAAIKVKEIVPAGRATPVVSMRNALMCGLPKTNFVPDKDLKIHGLYVNDKPGGLWMTDSPQELFQLHEFISKAHGNVLIGGLGLGCATHLAALKKEVVSTLTVEINKDILNLQPLVARKGEIAQADIFNVVKEIKPGAFSTAYLDTWAGTGERFWTSQVVPLRRLLRGKIPPEGIVCWAEPEMHGQILHNLFRAADMDQDQLTGHYRVFRQFITESRPRARLNTANAIENMNNKEILGAARLFLYGVGTDEWERAFGSYWNKEIADD